MEYLLIIYINNFFKAIKLYLPQLGAPNSPRVASKLDKIKKFN